jgi:hypothetical protein
VSHITKHDSEKERESNTSKNSWVDFLVHGDTISVHNFLESPCELIGLDVGGWLNSVVAESLEVGSRVLLEYFPDFTFLGNWTPEEANIGTSTRSHVVERMIESLFFGNEPLVHL